jgi:hypothetical protein
MCKVLRPASTDHLRRQAEAAEQIRSEENDQQSPKEAKPAWLKQNDEPRQVVTGLSQIRHGLTSVRLPTDHDMAMTVVVFGAAVSGGHIGNGKSEVAKPGRRVRQYGVVPSVRVGGLVTCS